MVTLPVAGLPPSFQSTVQVWVSPAPGSVIRAVTTAGLPTDVRVRRLAGLLARKGYPAGLAFRVVKEALAEEGQEAELAFDQLQALDDD